VVEAGALLEVADRELDLGVAALVGLDLGERLGAVGEEGVVAPVGKQLGLGAEEAGAANDEPASAQGALGDLGDPPGRVTGKRLPGLLADQLDRGADVCLLADADRVADIVALERLDRLVTTMFDPFNVRRPVMTG
jgi:hypothetical protein